MGSRLRGDNFARVYAAAQDWVEAALRSDGSLFTPGQAVWTNQALQELRGRFLEKPDKSNSSFMQKLQTQLDGSYPEAYQLMGEALYTQYLVDDLTKGETKAQRVRDVLGWSPAPVELPPHAEAPLSSGLLKAGAGFTIFRPEQIGFILEFVEHWKTLAPDEQQSLLGDPWQFRELLWSMPLTSRLLMGTSRKANAQRLALMHLVFPDTFEAIVATEHRDKIAKTFANLVSEPNQNIDLQLREIRQQMEAAHGDKNWLFYHEPIKLKWDPPKPTNDPWTQFVDQARGYVEGGTLEEQEIDYKIAVGEKLAEARKAVLASVEGWQDLVKRAIGNNLVFQIQQSRFRTWLINFPQDALEALRSVWRDDDYSLATRIQDFSSLLPESDVGEVQGTGIAGTGTRASLISVLLMALDVNGYPPYRRTYFDEVYKLTEFAPPQVDSSEATLYEHALGFLDRFIEEAANRDLEIGTRLEAQSLVWMVIKGEKSTEGDPRPGLLETLAEELNLPLEFLVDIQQLLEEKKQVIFQGPPGTGKTYVARALAKYIAGSPDRVMLVQFHPSYAYEDFVQGFRPKIDGQGFELRDGPLREIAELARNNEDKKFVLVVDEINRGNIGKIFGELYFLLEYRDSEIRLQYSDREFSLPNNLFLIGTMNTADRSIALVDLALRRRFYFKNFHPDDEAVKGVLRRWLRKNAPAMEWVADLVAAANEKMTDDRHAAIGPSYFMRDHLDYAAVKRIWEHSVLPYIEEWFFGNQERLEEFALSKLMPGHSSVDSVGSETQPGTNDDDDRKERND